MSREYTLMIDYNEIPLSQRRFFNFDGSRKEYRISRTQLAILKLGAICTNCGYDKDIRGLEIDHILSDGALERTRFDNDKIATWIYLAFKHNIQKAIEIVKERYQVLCATCNKIKQHKHRENGDLSLEYLNIGCIERVKELRYLISPYISKGGR